jgi:excisionase family DNA binding protein
MNPEEITYQGKLAYSVEEASERTSLSKAYLRLEIGAGRLKVKRFGRRVLILSEDLQSYLQSGADSTNSATESKLVAAI